MLSGKYRGTDIGSGTNTWSMSEDLRAGRINAGGIPRSRVVHEPLARPLHDHGHGLDHGLMVEALGVGLPATRRSRRSDARRNVLARAAGRRAVGMVKEGLTLSKILTREAFRERHPGERRDRRLDQRGDPSHRHRQTHRRGPLARGLRSPRPRRACLVNLMPSGKYLMEDFYYAGGLPAVIASLGANRLLHKDARTANGKTICENNREAPAGTAR